MPDWVENLIKPVEIFGMNTRRTGNDFTSLAERYGSRKAPKPFVIMSEGMACLSCCPAGNDGNRGIAVITAVSLGKRILWFPKMNVRSSIIN